MKVLPMIYPENNEDLATYTLRVEELMREEHRKLA